MKKVASLNEAAFEQLYKRYSDRWFNFFKRRMSGNSEAANDLLQELCLRIVTKASSFDYSRSFKVWSFTIAHNLVKNEYRRNENQVKLSDKYKQLTVDHEVHSTIDSSKRTNLEELLAGFGENDRELFYLRFGEELKLKEIAAIQQQPLGTVKSRLSRLMKTLSAKVTILEGDENEL